MNFSYTEVKTKVESISIFTLEILSVIKRQEVEELKFLKSIVAKKSEG